MTRVSHFLLVEPIQCQTSSSQLAFMVLGSSSCAHTFSEARKSLYSMELPLLNKGTNGEKENRKQNQLVNSVDIEVKRKLKKT